MNSRSCLFYSCSRRARNQPGIRVYHIIKRKICQLVSWCFEPSQSQRITSGLNTNFTLSPSHSFHKSCFFFSLFIFSGHSTRESASSRMTYFILRAYTGTCVIHSQHRKNSRGVLEKNAGEWTGRISKEEIPGSKRSMYGCIVTYSRL